MSTTARTITSDRESNEQNLLILQTQPRHSLHQPQKLGDQPEPAKHWTGCGHGPWEILRHNISLLSDFHRSLSGGGGGITGTTSHQSGDLGSDEISNYKIKI